jgi:hypothetical protein
MLVSAQLVITVYQPKTSGQKAVIEITMKNELTNKIKSARALCLLLDGHGKMVGQSTKWVIGQNATHLDPKGESKFNFVISTPQPSISSNLTAKVVFSRVILDDGKVADVRRTVEVMSEDKSKTH